MYIEDEDSRLENQGPEAPGIRRWKFVLDLCHGPLLIGQKRLYRVHKPKRAFGMMTGLAQPQKQREELRHLRQNDYEAKGMEKCEEWS